MANFGTDPPSDAFPQRGESQEGRKDERKKGDLSGISYVRERCKINWVPLPAWKMRNFHPFMLRLPQSGMNDDDNCSKDEYFRTKPPRKVEERLLCLYYIE